MCFTLMYLLLFDIPRLVFVEKEIINKLNILNFTNNCLLKNYR